MGQPKTAPKKFRGVFNRYQKSKGLFKYVTEDIRSLFTILYLFVRNGFRHRVLVAYPHYPSKRSTIYRIAAELGYVLTNKLNDGAEAIVYWEYQTFRSEFEPLETFADRHQIKVVNRHSRDISKLFVDQVFSAVFGYSTQVDPLSFKGLYVEKSDINAKHDGRVLAEPLKVRESEKIYQLLIDNSVEGGLVQDLRVPLYAGTIPFVFVKYRPIGERFKNSTIKNEMFPPEDIFSNDELRLIKAFAAKMELDHGELDILRDKQSKRIYIVDVNNTPQSPPANCTRTMEREAVRLMAASFAKNILGRSP